MDIAVREFSKLRAGRPGQGRERAAVSVRVASATPGRSDPIHDDAADMGKNS